MSIIRALIRDIKIATKESVYVPYLFEDNNTDHTKKEDSEYSVLAKPTIPGKARVVAEYMLPTLFEKNFGIIRVDARDEKWRRPDENWYFINGIMTTREVAQVNAQMLSRMFDKVITVLHNPTYGFGKDIGECILGRTFNRRSNVSFEAASIIAGSLRNEIPTKIIGHSQGGIITSNLIEHLKDFGLTQEQFQYLEVYTFAGAQDEMEDHAAHSEHFANEKDFVARIGIMRRDAHIAGPTYVRKSATGHLLNQHYLNAFRNGLYCNGESRLFSYLAS